MRGWTACLAVFLFCSGATTGVDAQEAGETAVSFSVGGGLFHFLNETTVGGVLHVTPDRGASVAPDFALWLASPGNLLGALDASFMVGLRPEGASPFFRYGAGAVVGEDVFAPGFLVGCGVMLRSREGAAGFRVDGVFHWYGSHGGVPMASLTAAVIP